MNRDLLRFYTLISGLNFPKTYRGKIMLVAFIGTHIPLIALIVYAVFTYASSWDTIVTTLLVTLIATLVSTGVTLYILYFLLSPITLTSKTLRQYLQFNICEREVPRCTAKDVAVSVGMKAKRGL